MSDDKSVTESEAVRAGLALLQAKWPGDSDFSRGMRLLQERILLEQARREIAEHDERNWNH
jgi:Arc/MetJ-type ribon-helix-helix transcriptional regulator